MGEFTTQERRIFGAARWAWKALAAVILTTLTVAGLYYGVIARQAMAETQITLNTAAVEKLFAEKQSKEAAKGDRDTLGAQLDAIGRTLDSIDKRLSNLESRKR